MTMLALKLFFSGMLKRLWEALWSALRWAGRNPWQAAVLLLCGLCAGGYWHYSGKVEKLTATVAIRDKTISDMKAASEQNRLAQIAAVKAKEQHYKDIANEADKEHAEQLADANDALARYIATHRVRAATSDSGLSPASPGAESGSAAVPASLPADSFVAVSDDDMHRCNALATYALDAHNWAVKLER